MPNMFNVLYTRYIDQIKLQEIENYNKKHLDYIVRSGKQMRNPEQYQNSKVQKPARNQSQNQNPQPRSVKPQTNQNEAVYVNQNKENPRKKQFPAKKYVENQNPASFNEDRPLNQQKMFNFTEYPEQQPIKIQINQQPQERAIKPTQQIQKQAPQMTEFAEEDEIVLQECPEGCGRKFKPETLEKHIKICQKVFQGKRKPFKVDVVDDQAKNIAQKNEKADSKTQKPKQDKVPKWKKESEMLRRGLKAQEANSQKSIPVEEQDDRIQCKGCGRKFNEDAAKRHIESCMNRNKQKR